MSVEPSRRFTVAIARSLRAQVMAASFIAAVIFLGGEPAVSADAHGQTPPARKPLYVVDQADQYFEEDLLKAVNEELKTLPTVLTLVRAADDNEQGSYFLKNVYLRDLLRGQVLELGADYSQGIPSLSTPEKSFCCDCRADPQRAARLVVGGLFSNTLLHPERGPYKLIRVDTCQAKSDNVVELVVDLQGSLGFERQGVVYTVFPEELSIILYPQGPFEKVSDSVVRAEFRLFGKGDCLDVEHKKLRIHLDMPEPCIPGQQSNKGRE